MIRFTYIFTIALMIGIGVQYSERMSYFHINQVHISSEENTPLQQADQKAIFEAVKPYLTGSYFSININRATEAASNIAWVASAKVERHFPNQVKILIHEHQAQAYWVRSNYRAGIVSEKGAVFQAALEQKLPEFDGEADVLPAMLQQYKALNQRLKPLRLQVQRLQYSPRAAWTARLNNGIEIRLGKTDIAGRLQRLIQAWPKLVEQEQNIDYIDLRYSNGYAVRYHHLKQPSHTETEALKQP